MTESAAIAATAILAALALFQAAIAAGAPLGQFAWGGQHRVLPSRLRAGSVVSIGLYAVFAVVLLDRAGVTSILVEGRTVRVLAWVLAGYFVIGIVMNAISRSKPERITMTPVAIVLAILAIIVAAG